MRPSETGNLGPRRGALGPNWQATEHLQVSFRTLTYKFIDELTILERQSEPETGAKAEVARAEMALAGDAPVQNIDPVLRTARTRTSDGLHRVAAERKRITGPNSGATVHITGSAFSDVGSISRVEVKIGNGSFQLQPCPALSEIGRRGFRYRYYQLGSADHHCRALR